MFFAKIPRHTSQNAITEGDLECILTRNCEGTEQLRMSGVYLAVIVVVPAAVYRRTDRTIFGTARR